MYFYCDCSLERLKRGHSGSPQEPFCHKTCTRGRAFSQCCAAQGFQPVHSHAVQADEMVGNRSERVAGLPLSETNLCGGTQGPGMP